MFRKQERNVLNRKLIGFDVEYGIHVPCETGFLHFYEYYINIHIEENFD